jgi:RNA polymerase sigma factor (sigma-70 family)
LIQFLISVKKNCTLQYVSNIRKLKICMHIDFQTLKNCASDDRRAQKILFEYTFKLLMPLCLRYHNNEEDARSSLNLSFIKIINGLKVSKIEEINYDPWAKKIATNTLIDEYRKTKIQLTHFQTKETERELDFLAENTENDAESDLGCQTVMGLLKKLPETSAKVFNLYVIDGYNHKEIGDLLEISEGTSKWHLSIARKMLREMLEKIESRTEKKLVI